MFEDGLKEMINYFAKKERIDYYKKTFGYKSTKQVLVKDYGETNYGQSSFNKGWYCYCNNKYIFIADKNTKEEKEYSWGYIAEEVDKIIDGNKSPEQLSLF